MKQLIFFSLLLISVPVCTSALAQGLPSNSSEPIEITADQSLEWHRNDLQFIARTNAKAQQGAVSVSGETLIADYKSSDESSIDIWQLTAQNNVTIQNEDSTATGDKAVYNVETGIATLTGSNLKLISPDQTITANDKFIYDTTARKASAIGNAKVVRAEDTIEASTIEAIFKENGSSGQQTVETMEAKGNVVITTPAELLSGDYAIYKSASNTAEISGNVKITRGPNVLEGAKAEVDLTTNISKMFGSERTGERVRGVFYPGTAKETPSPATEEQPSTSGSMTIENPQISVETVPAMPESPDIPDIPAPLPPADPFVE